jgi:uncharacterized membrane protein
MSSSPSAWSGPRLWLVALMVLSIVGIADSGYLLQRHARGGSGFCPAYGCDVVNQGEYAEVNGIPVAAFGIAGYLALLALSVMAAALGGRSVIRTIFILSGVGVIVSAYLVYLQVAVIKSICFWCVVSAVTMVSIFILSVLLVRKMRPLDLSEPAAQEGAI